MNRLRTSRQRYQSFVKDYRSRHVDEPAGPEARGKPPGKSREYLREYLRWL